MYTSELAHIYITIFCFQIKNLFTYNTSENFYIQSLPDFGYFGTVIIERKDGGNILNSALWTDLTALYETINTTVAYDDSGNSFTYADICAKRLSSCVVEGDLIFTSSFISDMDAGTISYPTYTYLGRDVYIDRIVGGVQVSNNLITTAKSIKLTFNLESEQSILSHKWELAFIDEMAAYTSETFSVKYSYSDSLTTELSKSVTGDIVFFSVTFTLMIMFSSLTLMGAGVLGTGLAILGSLGFVSLCGASFVDMVGAMPFLILGNLTLDREEKFLVNIKCLIPMVINLIY